MSVPVAKKNKTKKDKEISVQRAIKRTLILACAYLMEEEHFNKELIFRLYSGVISWSENIKNKEISITKVVDIINDFYNEEVVKW